ncbi:MAG: NAD(P)H-hydrate dehydratase [bacterium]|nr:NAD(P)H-hydrate dehydratase [bacterium]
MTTSRGEDYLAAMEILTGRQMREADRHAIDVMGIPGLQLMEAAGRGVAEALLEEQPSLFSRPVWILCGKGNNGGDGLVVARELRLRELHPHVILLARATDLTGDAAASLRKAREAGVPIVEVTDAEAWSRERAGLDANPIVVDAMLGTGVSGGPRGTIAIVIDDLNDAGVEVFSIDLPSGLEADAPDVVGRPLRALRTYTLCRPKPALVQEPAAALCGSFRVIPIGIPDEAVERQRSRMEWLDHDAAASLLPPRDAASHKGTYGHLLAVAGSLGKAGAAALLARGALRSGVGLLTVATPAGVLPTLAAHSAECMTEPLPETAAGVLDAGAARTVATLAATRDALAVGPGLSNAPDVAREIREIVARRTLPVVLDADGLNAFAGDAAALRGAAGPLVITPHPGEAARLLGVDTREIQADRLGAARRLADATGAVVVLKGHRTLVVSHDGAVAVNAGGNPGMATGGSGDVLTGTVGAFLARGLDAFDAARLGVHAHAAAGDLAAVELGQDGLIAGDVVDRLPAALLALSRTRAAS